MHRWPLVDIQSLEKVKLDKSLDKEKYQRELEACREKLENLHNQLYRKKIPVVIAYEGWDAAGKGGNIKRLASALDPREMCIRDRGCNGLKSGCVPRNEAAFYISYAI